MPTPARAKTEFSHDMVKRCACQGAQTSVFSHAREVRDSRVELPTESLPLVKVQRSIRRWRRWEGKCAMAKADSPDVRPGQRVSGSRGTTRTARNAMSLASRICQPG